MTYKQLRFEIQAPKHEAIKAIAKEHGLALRPFYAKCLEVGSQALLKKYQKEQDKSQ